MWSIFARISSDCDAAPAVTRASAVFSVRSFAATRSRSAWTTAGSGGAMFEAFGGSAGGLLDKPALAPDEAAADPGAASLVRSPTIATRKPAQSVRRVGEWLLYRSALRQNPGQLSQPPPRNTRSLPVTGPGGSLFVEMA